VQAKVYIAITKSSWTKVEETDHLSTYSEVGAALIKNYASLKKYE
jgi:hypothetical protein